MLLWGSRAESYSVWCLHDYTFIFIKPAPHEVKRLQRPYVCRASVCLPFSPVDNADDIDADHESDKKQYVDSDRHYDNHCCICRHMTSRDLAVTALTLNLTKQSSATHWSILAITDLCRREKLTRPSLILVLFAFNQWLNEQKKMFILFFRTLLVSLHQAERWCGVGAQPR